MQIVQAQTNRGSDGFFGKTWVEVSGDRMRLVSGYARKTQADDKRQKRDAGKPLRLIQILDLGATSLYLIDPSTKAYQVRSLSDVRYAEFLRGRLSRGAPRYRVTSSTVTIEPGHLRRPLLEALCEHFHVSVALTLEEPRNAGGRPAKPVLAAMEQDVWMAPVAGVLQKGLLDLIAFDSRYRRLTQRDLSPLDFGVYHLPEAAAYLRAPSEDVEAVVLKVKRELLAVPGYPLSSSVSWFRKTSAPRRAPKPVVDKPVQAPAAQAPPPAPVRIRPLRRPKFRPIDLQGSWRILEQENPDDDDSGRARRDRRETLRRTGQALRRHHGYPGFQNEMRRVIESLETLQMVEYREAEFSPPPLPPPQVMGDTVKVVSPTSTAAKAASPSPFYEIFAELDSFEFRDRLPAEDFTPPTGFERREIGIMPQ